MLYKQPTNDVTRMALKNLQKLSADNMQKFEEVAAVLNEVARYASIIIGDERCAYLAEDSLIYFVNTDKSSPNHENAVIGLNSLI